MDARDLMSGAQEVYDREHSAWKKRNEMSWSQRWKEKIAHITLGKS